MKHLLILTLLLSFLTKPAKAEIGTIAVIGVAVMVGLVVNDFINENKE